MDGRRGRKGQGDVYLLQTGSRGRLPRGRTSLATAWKTTVSNTRSIFTSAEWSRLRFSIALPPTLPRNGLTPTGRLLYWLVGTIEGLPDGKHRAKAVTRPSPSCNDDSASPASSSSSPSATSALPSYSNAGSDASDIEWLRGSVQSERRIAVSHNPNPEGGITRFDDDFTHNLPEFGTCRVQTRVNEVGQYRICRADGRSGVWVVSFHCASHV